MVALKFKKLFNAQMDTAMQKLDGQLNSALDDGSN
jgi:hypothetical protein